MKCLDCKKKITELIEHTTYTDDKEEVWVVKLCEKCYLKILRKGLSNLNYAGIS